MSKLQDILNWLNRYQKNHRWVAFAVAVVKKYGADGAGRRAALLTYYLFLALFPLLLVLTTITDRIDGGNSHFKTEIIKGITNYFPLLGSQLSAHVHTLHKSGLALVFGILLTLYGTRGVADVFVGDTRHIWGLPEKQNEPFVKAVGKNISLVIIGGLGFILAAICAGLAASAGHGAVFRILSIAVNLIILFALFTFLLNASLPKHVSLKEVRPGAIAAAISLVILQFAGTYILAHELKNLDALYSTFAVALSLLFWLYLQAQVIYYAIEIAAVSSQELWPRDLT